MSRLSFKFYRQSITVLLLVVILSEYSDCNHKTNRKDDENEDEVLVDMEELDVDDAKMIVCEEGILMEFLAQLQAINPESIVNIATKDSAENTCKKLARHKADLGRYLATCEAPREPDLYMDLLHGVSRLQMKLCYDVKFKRAFRPHADCLMELTDEFEDCTGPPDWEECGDTAKMCKTYGKISNCYFIKAATLCGMRAAKSMKVLLRAVIDSILLTKCDNVIPDPFVADPMPEESCNVGIKQRPSLLVVSTMVLAVVRYY